MNEAQWLSCDNFEKMLAYLKRSGASERKVRLLAVALCRRIWHLLDDPRSRRAVEVAEKYADGLVKQQEMFDAGKEAEEAGRHEGGRLLPTKPGSAAFATAVPTPWVSQVAQIARVCLANANQDADVTRETILANEVAFQRDLIREVFGNPFAFVTVAGPWLTANNGSVRRLAESIYNDKRFEDVPILGDALQEVGCNEQAILDHCRNGREHVRGCWVLDLLLNKN